ncbi:hypothetical protein ABG067_006393 [Albugo candida]|uniref:Uncharacterized protein n=1 Tax=Albugo candida TaxID=65357 RepID=A0A024G9X3_9STRA|nr:unnamed protein product [Albugo candida]|eukprot:CCI43558.1 unnamed protein product [Albugo candida]
MAAKVQLQRCSSANRLLILFNPHTVPQQLVEEMEGMYQYQPKSAINCQSDLMIAQRKDVSPPVAFMLLSDMLSNQENEAVVSRLQKAANGFKNLFCITIIKPKVDFQAIFLRKNLPLKNFSVGSTAAAAKLIASIHGKLSKQVTEQAHWMNKQLSERFYTRSYAISFLVSNFRFLTPDECEMLLDFYGTITELAQKSASELLEDTVLSASAATAFEEFFASEYELQ